MFIFQTKKIILNPKKPITNMLANPKQSPGLWAILQIYKFKKKYFTNYNPKITHSFVNMLARIMFIFQTKKKLFCTPKNAHSFVNVVANPEQSPGLWASQIINISQLSVTNKLKPRDAADHVTNNASVAQYVR
jgi:hypothetical protein